MTTTWRTPELFRFEGDDSRTLVARHLKVGIIIHRMCMGCAWQGEGKGKVVPVLNYWGEWRYGSTHSLTSTLDGGEWSASRSGRFTPQRKGPRYPLDRRLGGPQIRSGRGVEEKNSQYPPGFEPRSSDRPARSQSLYRLRCTWSVEKS
jgi:hypothetical protein